VSGRIAATAPFPAEASDDSCDIAEKSFVNDVAEIDGGAAAELVVLDAAAELLVVVLDEFELPHAAMPILAVAASMAIEALLFSKCTIISSFLRDHAKVRSTPARRCQLG
jgi:hypothetical protein